MRNEERLSRHASGDTRWQRVLCVNSTYPAIDMYSKISGVIYTTNEESS